MPVWFWIAIVAGGALLVLVAIWGGWGFTRSRALRSEFGAEYDHAVKRLGSRRKAEHELRRRRERRGELEIRTLDPQTRSRYLALWSTVQEGFVDDPEGTALEAERLIREVMTLRGYPPADSEQRAADLSLDDPAVASEYRQAREIMRSGRPSTDKLREAVRHYRTAFHELVGNGRQAATRPAVDTVPEHGVHEAA